MPDLILLFNHTLTPEQKEDAVKSLRVERFITMPDSIRNVWGQIPAELETIKEYLEPVRVWLSQTAKGGDYVLIQGDFGAAYLMVEYAKQHNMIPVYATTRREAVERLQADGSMKITHLFKHVLFREFIR